LEKKKKKNSSQEIGTEEIKKALFFLLGFFFPSIFVKGDEQLLVGLQLRLLKGTCNQKWAWYW